MQSDRDRQHPNGDATDQPGHGTAGPADRDDTARAGAAPAEAGPVSAAGAGQRGSPPEGAPITPKGPRRWSGRRTVAAAALAVGIAVTGGAAVAATGLGDGGTAAVAEGRGPGDQGGAAGQDPSGQLPGGGPGMGVAGGVLDEALHGDVVVSDGNGGYATRRIQLGEVTAVATDSITVKSADGFTGTYAVNSSTVLAGGTIDQVEVGHTVSVTASVSGSTTTALSIVDRTLAQSDQLNGQQGMPPGGAPGMGAPGQDSGTAPGGTGSSGGTSSDGVTTT
jgi:hypothetical protein